MVYHTFGLRVIARLIDNGLLLPLVFLYGEKERSALGLLTITIFILEHSYFIIGHAQYGQTLGKKLMGVKVVSAHQFRPLTWTQAIQRELIWVLLSIIYIVVNPDPTNVWAAVPALLLVSLDAALALIHPQNRSLRDFIGRTVVIRTASVEKAE